MSFICRPEGGASISNWWDNFLVWEITNHNGFFDRRGAAGVEFLGGIKFTEFKKWIQLNYDPVEWDYGNGRNFSYEYLSANSFLYNSGLEKIHLLSGKKELVIDLKKIQPSFSKKMKKFDEDCYEAYRKVPFKIHYPELYAKRQQEAKRDIAIFIVATIVVSFLWFRRKKKKKEHEEKELERKRLEHRDKIKKRTDMGVKEEAEIFETQRGQEPNDIELLELQQKKRGRQERDRKERLRKAREEKKHKEHQRHERARQDHEYQKSYNRHSESPQKNEDLYAKILGLDASRNMSEIKKKYLKMMAQTHPDKVSHLSEALQKMAEEETKKLTAVYDFFKKLYGEKPQNVIITG